MDRGKYVMSVRNLILSIIDQSKELKSLSHETNKTNRKNIEDILKKLFFIMAEPFYNT